MLLFDFYWSVLNLYLIYKSNCQKRAFSPYGWRPTLLINTTLPLRLLNSRKIKPKEMRKIERNKSGKTLTRLVEVDFANRFREQNCFFFFYTRDLNFRSNTLEFFFTFDVLIKRWIVTVLQRLFLLTYNYFIIYLSSLNLIFYAERIKLL